MADDGGTTDGVTSEDTVPRDELDKAMKALKAERKKSRDATSALKKFDGLDPDEARDALEVRDAAEAAKAKADGDWEQIREKLEAKHAKVVDGLTAERDAALSGLERHVVDGGLTQAIADAGFMDEYRPAVHALLMQRGPRAVSDDGEWRAVVTDELGDAIELGNFVKAWSETDAAQPFMPGPGTGGSGSDPGTGRRPATPGGKPVISASDPVAMGREAEKIAKGEVEVVMD